MNSHRQGRNPAAAAVRIPALPTKPFPALMVLAPQLIELLLFVMLFFAPLFSAAPIDAPPLPGLEAAPGPEEGWVGLRPGPSTASAVVDRVVDERFAVLLVGADERELVVDRDALPPGSRTGHWLRLSVDTEGRIVASALDPQETEAARRRIEGKLAVLRRR